MLQSAVVENLSHHIQAQNIKFSFTLTFHFSSFCSFSLLSLSHSLLLVFSHTRSQTYSWRYDELSTEALEPTASSLHPCIYVHEIYPDEETSNKSFFLWIIFNVSSCYQDCHHRLPLSHTPYSSCTLVHWFIYI